MRGTVYSLSQTERDEQEDRETVFRQRKSIDALDFALQMATAVISALEFPLGCPVRGYDQADLLETLEGLKATQTATDIELACEVRRAETNALRVMTPKREGNQ